MNFAEQKGERHMKRSNWAVESRISQRIAGMSLALKHDRSKLKLGYIFEPAKNIQALRRLATGTIYHRLDRLISKTL